MLTVGLFVPCYIDQFYPEIAVATMEILEKTGCKVSFPLNQTCCGQPMANSGFARLTSGCNKNFIRNFSGVDYIVAPSGSCVLHIREHLAGADGTADVHLREKVFELSEFLVDILKVRLTGAEFAHRVGLHTACHGQRGLHTSSMTELMEAPFSKPEKLLSMVSGLQLVKPRRSDECCGFGGTFCVFEEAVSAKMGKDRVAEQEALGVDFITSTDVSCLMHMEGILKKKT